MATLPPGTIVDLSEHASEVLRFVPPDGDLVVVVHPAALSARWDTHTQVAQIVEGWLTWLGALGEAMLVTLDDAPPDHDARATCAHAMLRGERLWQIVRPGALLVPDAPHEPSSVYAGSDRRPWVVIGETDLGDPIAAPLNEASNPKWWTPVVPRAALAFPDSVKDAQLELAHLWSLPADVPSIGEVTALGRGAIERAVEAYVGA
ncbi:MAG: hypothetical protein EA416_17475 [Trueperaceae bacterium]|nr:MAG: hypothetical protein EA416_17475 [Trueperaceae bacterium]